MNLKRHLLEAVTLVAAAVLCALISNALAPRERKLALVGSYPNATSYSPPAPTATGGAAAVAEDSSKVKKAPAGGARPGSASGPAVAASAPPSLPFSEKTAPASHTPQTTSRLSPSDLRERFPPHPDKPYIEISGDDAARLQASGVLLLDARRTTVYKEGHIAGARSVPVWESDVDEKVLALLNEGRDMAAPVVIYCSGGDCEDSHMLAQKLFGAGFSNLLVYRDGWPDWQKRRGPSAAGPET